MMMSSIIEVDFSDYTESIPAFMCIAMMPLTYSIAEGIILGLPSYVFINALQSHFIGICFTNLLHYPQNLRITFLPDRLIQRIYPKTFPTSPSSHL